MKITFEIFDDYIENHLYLLNQNELLAFKLCGESVVHVKTVKCNFCGDCCRGLSQLWHLGLNENGDCKYLVDGKCSLIGGPPISCLTGRQAKGLYNNTHCSIEYIEQEII